MRGDRRLELFDAPRRVRGLDRVVHGVLRLGDDVREGRAEPRLFILGARRQRRTFRVFRRNRLAQTIVKLRTQRVDLLGASRIRSFQRTFRALERVAKIVNLLGVRSAKFRHLRGLRGGVRCSVRVKLGD